jgi:hypothetical protein
MLRALFATALALSLFAVAALAARGVSTAPYVPDPVEFALDARVPPARVAGAQGFVAEPLRTPKRFNLAGLSWSGRAEPAVALRARRDGGPWSRWTPASSGGHHAPEAGGGERSKRRTSDPVWVGEADWVQYRLSRRVPGLRLHFVNTTGTATAADRALTRLRTLARAAVVRVSSAWAATPGRPRIRPRSEWGAAKCPTRGVDYGSVRAAVVHHTVTANAYSRAQAPAAILAVCRFHRNTNGWNDIGYNFVVDRFGRIWEGRAGGTDEAVAGAHAQGYNSQTTGIANLGNYSERPQSEAAIAAMARLIRWKLAAHGIPYNGRTTLRSAGGPSARYPAGDRRSFSRVSGHRDTGVTACPGTHLYRQLPELRERVGEKLPTGAPVRVEAPLPELVTYSAEGVGFGGRIADSADAPVEGAALELQQLVRTGWETLATATSASDGTFGASAVLTTATPLRWKFAGEAAYRPHRGDGVVVAVAPAISLTGSDEAIAPGESVDLTGSIAPPKRRNVNLVVERREGTAWRRAGGQRLTPKQGQIARSWTFEDAGDYRLSVRFAGDALNAAAVSPYVEVQVREQVLPF